MRRGTFLRISLLALSLRPTTSAEVDGILEQHNLYRYVCHLTIRGPQKGCQCLQLIVLDRLLCNLLLDEENFLRLRRVYLYCFALNS